jgi:hypothetical protein
MWGETPVTLVQIGVNLRSLLLDCGGLHLLISLRFCVKCRSGVIFQGKCQSEIELGVLEMHEVKYFSAQAGQAF